MPKPQFTIFFLQNGTKSHSVLAKIQAEKQVNSYQFQPFRPFVLSIFQNNTCILHHFVFLVWLPTRIFSSPITHFQALKPNILMTILPFLVLCFMVIKGFIYTITVDFYAYRLASSSILNCVQHQNALRLAPKRTAFSSILHCIQRQNALRLAANYTAFSSKQPQNGCKWRSPEINIHFACIYNYPLFASKQTFARINFLRQGRRLVSYEGSHNVKIRTKNFTEIQEQHGKQWLITAKRQSDWLFQQKAFRWQTMADGNKKKPLPDRGKAQLALTTPHRATVKKMLITVLSHYQSDKRWFLGINNLSPSFTPKASYQASICGRAPFTRHLPSACGSAFVRLRISCSVMFCPQTAA